MLMMAAPPDKTIVVDLKFWKGLNFNRILQLNISKYNRFAANLTTRQRLFKQFPLILSVEGLIARRLSRPKLVAACSLEEARYRNSSEGPVRTYGVFRCRCSY